MSQYRQDIRDTPLYREAEAFYRIARAPGTGQVSDAAELHVSPDGKQVVFTGAILDTLEDTPRTRICAISLVSGDLRVLTHGPNSDRLPKWSSDGRHVAFLSDRHNPGDFQLHLLDLCTGLIRATSVPVGWVEFLQWSPDGRRILLGVAGHGADLAGAQGGTTTSKTRASMPSWIPVLETGDEDCRWRRAWVYELKDNRLRQVSSEDTNVWEAVWCGNDSIAAVTSSGASEGLWYSARLHVIDIHTGKNREIYASSDQLGWPATSPSGQRLAIIEAISSDRWLLSGDLMLIDTTSGEATHVQANGLDINYAEWRSDQALLLAGHRGFEVVIGLYNVASGHFDETWVSSETTMGARYMTLSGINDSGDCVLVSESFVRAPEIAVIRGHEYQTIKSLDLGYQAYAKAIRTVELLRWKAPDGLEIQGWLLHPKGSAPHPLVMYVHGGPVWHWRPAWLGRAGAAVSMLLERGHAVFFPNPRGSAGRGREFARRVIGDMGGADRIDLMSGIDHLVERGFADPERLSVTGLSYGGFMTSWLIAQDSRFAAAVSVAPMINYTTEHLLSNIPQFASMFLADTYTQPGGEYYKRSPIMYAHRVRTPTLNICGALDRSAPPQEAMQFHNALLENGVKSLLVTYPEEGHGIRKFPATIDYAARLVGWLTEHVPSQSTSS